MVAPIDSSADVSPLEMLASSAYGDVGITEVIRPSAILPEHAGRAILAELACRDVHVGGHWVSEPARWCRYDRPWNGPDGTPGGAALLGSIQIAHGTPRRFEITVFRVTITPDGAAAGWTVEGLCDEAFGYAELTLANCPRAVLSPPPRPFGTR